MPDNKKFYITTAIAYASCKPHIGNTYEVILTDAIARYKRARGYDVFFMTGTDEHGRKVEQLAEAAGVEPQKYVDGISAQIKSIWDLVGASYDKFIRTTDDYHVEAVKHIFEKLYRQGDIYKNEYEGWYCVPCESFFTDSQLGEGGVCPDCGRPVSREKEEAYFFKMSKYSDKLVEYMDTHPDFILPESRKREMINNFIKPGLQDLCVSRSTFKWGVPVSFDEKHIIYVWIDALSNYITGLGYDVDEQGPLYKKYWPADLHVIGKDILRFHSIYWPIILMALGLPLPKSILAHPWFNFGNDKMSKSKGNVIYADDLIDVFGRDAVRYYCLTEMPYSSDGSITYESVISRYNTDLANIFGNLVSRTAAMTEKYFGGLIPSPSAGTEYDAELTETVRQSVEKYVQSMDAYKTAEAAEAVFAALRRANKYIDETMPWALAKDESKADKLSTVLYNLLETIRICAILLGPFMPQTCDRVLARLGTDKTEFDTVFKFGAIESGAKLGADTGMLFSRMDEAKTLQTLSAAQTKEPPEGCAQIGIDDFMNVELRSAQVTDCQPVPKSKKLLKLQLDLGYEQRQVVSGIRQWYEPQDLIGKKVIVVANLKPAKLCGTDSNGMILACGEDNVRVVFLTEDTPLGERIR